MNYLNFSCIIKIISCEKGDMMENYRFTAFEKTGETLFDELWAFASDEAAKLDGQKQIEEKGVAEKTHRLVNSSGKLILFHV